MITVILTGSNDGLDDFIFKVSMISGTRKSGQESRFIFNLPFVSGYVQAYNDRQNGDLLCYVDSVLFFECNPKNLNYNIGALNRNLTIQGTKQTTNNTPKTYDFTGRIKNIIRKVDGKHVFSVVGFSDILPLDAIMFYSKSVGNSCYNILSYSFRINSRGFSFEFLEDSKKDDCFPVLCFPSLDKSPSLDAYPCLGV